MKACRFSLTLFAGFAVALALRDDRAASGAGPQALDAALRRRPATSDGVRAALLSAGASGLRMAFGLLDDPDAAVRAGAASYLGSRGSRLAVPTLIRLLRDPDGEVRRAAAKALGSARDRQALPFLERAVGEGEPLLAEAALGAVREIRRAEREPQSPLPLKVIPR